MLVITCTICIACAIIFLKIPILFLYRHSTAFQHPKFTEITKQLSLPDTKILQWSEEDRSVHPGADLQCGQQLYKDLQAKHPKFTEITKQLSLPDTKILQWSEEDRSVHPGADLQCGQQLYKDLQAMKHLSEETALLLSFLT